MLSVHLQKRLSTFDLALDLNAPPGVTALFGPSGAGKSMTLACIAGLAKPDAGRIALDDLTFFDSAARVDLPPQRRRVGYVMQDYLLFPHLSVGENVAFGLPRLSQAARRQTVDAMLERVGLAGYASRRPQELSGGQQQRVALARALVRKPAAFLMDEPLGALDAEFRESMRAEIKQLHIKQGATTVYVTHDQIEAMAMGDRIVIMSNAVVQQIGTPIEVYHNPANLFVARFIGSPGMNLIAGDYQSGVIRLPGNNTLPVPDAWRARLENDLPKNGQVIVGFRPEAAQVSADGGMNASVYASDLHGGYTMLHLELADSTVIHARMGRGYDYPIGTPVRFTIDPAQVRFFNPETEQALNGGQL